MRRLDNQIQETVTSEIREIFYDAITWRQLRPILQDFFVRNGLHMPPSGEDVPLLGLMYFNGLWADETPRDFISNFRLALDMVEKHLSGEQVLSVPRKENQ